MRTVWKTPSMRHSYQENTPHRHCKNNKRQPIQWIPVIHRRSFKIIKAERVSFLKTRWPTFFQVNSFHSENAASTVCSSKGFERNGLRKESEPTQTCQSIPFSVLTFPPFWGLRLLGRKEVWSEGSQFWQPLRTTLGFGGCCMSIAS